MPLSRLGRRAAAGFALLALALPAASASAAPADRTAATHLAAVAGRSFAAFRRAARGSDRIPAITSDTPATRRRLQRGASRLVAHGPDFRVFLVALPAGRATVLYVPTPKGRAEAGSRVSGRLSAFAEEGAVVDWTLPTGMVRSVIVVPDGVRDVRHLSGGGAAGQALMVRGNAIVDAAGGGLVQFRTRDGQRHTFALRIAQHAGTPVSLEALPGSRLTLLLDDGSTRELTVAGDAGGSFPGGFLLAHDNTLVVRTSGLGVSTVAAATPCSKDGLPAVAPSSLTIDPAGMSTITIGRDGAVSAHLVLVLRMTMSVDAGGCYPVSSGFTLSAFTLDLRGRITSPDGLGHLILVSDPTPVALSACLTPGDANHDCAKPPAAWTGKMIGSLEVSLKIA